VARCLRVTLTGSSTSCGSPITKPAIERLESRPLPEDGFAYELPFRGAIGDLGDVVEMDMQQGNSRPTPPERIHDAHHWHPELANRPNLSSERLGSLSLEAKLTGRSSCCFPRRLTTTNSSAFFFPLDMYQGMYASYRFRVLITPGAVRALRGISPSCPPEASCSKGMTHHLSTS
jgi:hypothetical protein